MFSSESLTYWAPWILLGMVLTGFLSYLVLQIQHLKKICSQNEEIIKLLLENQKRPKGKEEDVVEESTMIQVPEEDPNDGFFEESESELSSEYQLPYFEDSEEEEEEEKITVEFKGTSSSESRETGTGSSGYNTEQDIDYDWECYKIMRAPLGPVPNDQILLCFTCQITGLYLKAIVDKDQSAIWIMTYEKINDLDWDWVETTCPSCIQRVRDVLADGGCPTPFAMDLEKETFQYEKKTPEVEDFEAEENVIEKPLPTFPTTGFIITEPEYEHDSDAKLIE